jgi:dynactin complex subunit
MQQVQTYKEAIKNKIEKIAENLSTLKKQNDELGLENIKLSENLQSKQKQIEELEKQLNFTKIAKSINIDKDDKKDIKKIINEYVREIDKCISLLNE